MASAGSHQQQGLLRQGTSAAGAGRGRDTGQDPARQVRGQLAGSANGSWLVQVLHAAPTLLLPAVLVHRGCFCLPARVCQAAASAALAGLCPPSSSVTTQSLGMLLAPPLPICPRLAERVRARGYAQRVQRQWKRELIANDRELLEDVEEGEEGEEEEPDGGESEAEDEVPRFRILQAR